MTSLHAPTPGAPRPLVITADEHLLDDLLRLAAVAGVEVTATPDVVTARPFWPDAPLVLVGGDVAEAACAAGLSRRDGVVLVSRDLDDAQVWRRAVGIAAAQVTFLPDAEEWLVEALADAADRMSGVDRGGLCVGVVGGRGGAGASTLACALAVTAQRRGRRTMLVDADPLGGGIDLALGSEDAGGLRWPDLAGASGRISGASLCGALPRLEELTVLSWDRGDPVSVPPQAMQSLLDAAVRSNDLVVVDLPRYVDSATAVAVERLDVALLVVPAEVRATAAAARVAAGLVLRCPDLRVVVRGPAPAGLPAGGVVDALGLPFAGHLKPEPGLPQALDRGEAPGRRPGGPLAAFAESFLAGLDACGRAA